MVATKASSGSKTRSRATQDAIALLKADHRKVQQLFDQFEKSRSASTRLSLARQICTELKVHTEIEEEIFYPAARAAINNNALLDEAAIEHQSAKELSAQIQAGSSDEEMWSARVKVLGEYVRHHIREEQNKLFPEVHNSRLDLNALGQQLQARKQALMTSFKANTDEGIDQLSPQQIVTKGEVSKLSGSSHP